jgi:hypothetical protein
MSETKNESSNPLKEVTDKVVITPEDAQSAAEFWTHFDVPMVQGLKEAFEAFQKDPTLENQNRLKFLSVQAVGFTDHDAFNDEMFTEVVQQCRNIRYDMSFDQELRDVLQPEDK